MSHQTIAALAAARDIQVTGGLADTGCSPTRVPTATDPAVHHRLDSPSLQVRRLSTFRRSRGGFLAACLRISALLWVGAGLSVDAVAETTAPPNFVAITDDLSTSGQPPLAWLDALKANGYDAVIYLAPATVSDAVRDEPLSVSRQGLVFVNVPIRWEEPTERDFQTFSAVLSALGSRKVHVHCQLNYRASSMVFLHRSLVGGEDPAVAYEAVSRVWSPTGAWKRLLQEQLAKHGIAFEVF